MFNTPDIRESLGDALADWDVFVKANREDYRLNAKGRKLVAAPFAKAEGMELLPRSEYVHHGEIIEGEARRIAYMLTRSDDGAITETLTYAVREIMRNVVEHGQASHIWYAAQYWPTKNKVEVSILDEGVGLLPSLSRNPRLHVDSNQKAIILALQPGVSGIPKEKRRRSDGGWVNSGYGLFMTSSLCQAGGDFTICNGALGHR